MKTLSIETIGSLCEGELSDAFAVNLRRITEDLSKRAADGRKRTLTLAMSFEPAAPERGNPGDRVSVAFKIKTTLPPEETSAHQLQIQADRNGERLAFGAAPENVDQRMLGEDGGK